MKANRERLPGAWKKRAEAFGKIAKASIQDLRDIAAVQGDVFFYEGHREDARRVKAGELKLIDRNTLPQGADLPKGCMDKEEFRNNAEIAKEIKTHFTEFYGKKSITQADIERAYTEADCLSFMLSWWDHRVDDFAIMDLGHRLDNLFKGGEANGEKEI